MEQLVFIHNNSVLRHQEPDWVVYQDLFETQSKIVMRGVTCIDPSWLPTFCPALVTLGQHLDSPEPRYCPSSGQVVASYEPTFGQLGWQLPVSEQLMPRSRDKYKWFARALLEGQVCGFKGRDEILYTVLL